MNDLHVRREVNKIIRYGIPKYIAKEIIEVAMSVSKDDLNCSINYALALIYGFKFSNNKVINE